MRDIESNLDLAQLQAKGVGFILNARDDNKKLHRAKCEAVSAMVSSAYPKTFFDDYSEAKLHLDAEYGPDGWNPCGICNPR
ncbi:MAG TPA: hypothetical protein VJN67_01105 [Stellaceae bacterium]|nr:hypothetical protein [Stellaceae bacterium]